MGNGNSSSSAGTHSTVSTSSSSCARPSSAVRVQCSHIRDASMRLWTHLGW